MSLLDILEWCSLDKRDIGIGWCLVMARCITMVWQGVICNIGFVNKLIPYLSDNKLSPTLVIILSQVDTDITFSIKPFTGEI
jgi:hypothetical protein